MKVKTESGRQKKVRDEQVIISYVEGGGVPVWVNGCSSACALIIKLSLIFLFVHCSSLHTTSASSHLMSCSVPQFLTSLVFRLRPFSWLSSSLRTETLYVSVLILMLYYVNAQKSVMNSILMVIRLSVLSQWVACIYTMFLNHESSYCSGPQFTSTCVHYKILSLVLHV